MNLQQLRRLARIEKSLEMRNGLADYRCLMHLAHTDPHVESRDVAGIKDSSEAEFKVRLPSGEFELLHNSAGICFASDGREHIRIETVQDALVARIQKIFCFFNLEIFLKQLHKAPKVPTSAFRYL
jgi:hypothetical protein